MHSLNLFILTITFCLLIGCKNNPSNAQSETILKNESITIQKKSISKELKANEHLNIKERIALYLKLKREAPTDYNFENEDELTMYGYGLLWNNNPEDATEIFKLIVSQFPNSANPYDSLGEGYLSLGNEELALFNYKKSLLLNPENFNAEDAIERIKFPNKTVLTPQEKFSKVFLIEDYKTDIDELAAKLLSVHPNALKFTSKEAFFSLVETKKKEITANTTFAQFSWLCSEIIAAINCSHTSNGGFDSEWEMLDPALRFPLEVYWVEGGLYVVNNIGNENNIEIKDQILSINGIESSEIVASIFKHIPSQGTIETSKRYKFNFWASGMIPYALNFSKTYNLTVKGKQEVITLNQLKGSEKSFELPFKTNCSEELCLEFFNQNKTAILTISTFNFYPWKNLDVFTAFIDNAFQQIEKNKTQNLIIDLRGNGGGSAESSIYLLKHLINKPFFYFLNTENPKEQISHFPFKNTFKGKNYFIIDGKGNSTTGHFMAMAREYNLGTIVGEELGSNQFCTAGQSVLRLSNTKMLFYVANSTSQVKVGDANPSRGVLPDYEKILSIENYVNNEDEVRKFTLQLINNH